MLISIVRFWYNGWIEKLYIEPDFFFSYYGFSWIKPLGEYTYLLFLICGISAIMVSVGYRYRLAIITFFLSFTYIELMDKSLYLNHYYFISILSFLMIFLPAQVYYSVDAYRDEKITCQKVPRWSVDAIKFLLTIVYFYAGLAKLNSDWLLEAMPLKIWLPAKYTVPFLGDLLQKEAMHYLFSWSGAAYDLTIPFLLYYRKTRLIAFLLVVIFHALTAVLFPIGMFPYVMIVSALIFFDAKVHRRILGLLRFIWASGDRFLKTSQTSIFDNNVTFTFTSTWKRKLTFVTLSLFFLIQVLLPFRYMAYPDELFWTEEGYRFSWRVMLMEKSGYANFKIVEAETGKRFYVRNHDFLTSLQEKQMATQPDFILEYAHFLKQHFQAQGHKNPSVYVESYVALNGRRSQSFIDPKVDLTKVKDTFKHKDWILPFGDKIWGF